MSESNENFSYLAVHLDSSNDVVKYIFFREHLASGVDDGRSLFVTGLPAAFCDPKTILQALLCTFGEVGSLVMHPSQVNLVVGFTLNRG